MTYTNLLAPEWAHLRSKHGISWTRHTWNPLVGCSEASPGCTNCYARKMTARLAAMSLSKQGKGEDPGKLELYQQVVTQQGRWTGKALLWEPELLEPRRWRKPRLVFVNSMSDLFHESLRIGEVEQIFAAMDYNGRHIYQCLTKRPDRALHFVQKRSPVAHIWIGFSVCTQTEMDRILPIAQQVKALGWHTWFSVEPQLGPINVHPSELSRAIDWLVTGGESGNGARHYGDEWAAQWVSVCRAANIPCFVKQLGTVWSRQNGDPGLKGDDPSRWLESIRVQELPHEMVEVLLKCPCL